jgi:hypothetical protein
LLRRCPCEITAIVLGFVELRRMLNHAVRNSTLIKSWLQQQWMNKRGRRLSGSEKSIW